MKKHDQDSSRGCGGGGVRRVGGGGEQPQGGGPAAAAGAGRRDGGGRVDPAGLADVASAGRSTRTSPSSSANRSRRSTTRRGSHSQQPPADAKFRQQLELELLADAPNDQTIETLKQQIAAAQLEGLARHIAVQKQISQILTAEQRAKARERIAEGARDPGARLAAAVGGGFGSSAWSALEPARGSTIRRYANTVTGS